MSNKKVMVGLKEGKKGHSTNRDDYLLSILITLSDAS
jgi:hypothetical protein